MPKAGRRMKVLKKRFWNWVDEDTDEQILRLEGTIAEESWFDDDVTPALFHAELEEHPGDITVWINSPGGDVFAATQIYNLLMEHKGKVTVKIDSLAASAASVVAMAGTEVWMSPSAMFMVHNPMTMAFGWTDEMQKASKMLEEVKAAIINAYELKTGLSRAKISRLMDDETWMNATKAKELGFCDGILYKDEEEEPEAMLFAAKTCEKKLVAEIKKKHSDTKGTKHADLMHRLNILRH